MTELRKNEKALLLLQAILVFGSLGWGNWIVFHEWPTIDWKPIAILAAGPLVSLALTSLRRAPRS